MKNTATLNIPATVTSMIKNNKKPSDNARSKIKTALTVIVFLCISLASRNSFGQTYSAYQAGDQTSYGNYQWIGYVYDNLNQTGYMGYYTTGTANFTTNWGLGGPGPFGTTYLTDNETYMVRYKMVNTYENGLYTITSVSDDGVQVSSNGGTSWNVINDWSCTSSTRTATNVVLNGNTNFVMDYAECTAYAQANISITQTCQVPGSPQSLVGVATGLTSCTLSWSTGVPAGTNTYYYYSLYKASDNSLVTSSNQQTMTKALTGLLANTAYYFKVYSQAGCYAVSSATITSSTFYTGIIPGTPTSLTLTAIGTTTATLNWAAGRCCSQQGALRISDKQIFDRDMPCKFSIVSNEKKC
ncbi:MAG: fibronectin type III domain-containing protein [Bacteroidales bacterium]